jgi:hypothetical protein
MDIYRRHFRKTVFWFRTQLWAEKKIMKTPPLYYFFNMYSPTKSRGSGPIDLKKNTDDWHLFEKFVKKYPESMFAPAPMTLEPEMYSNIPSHPATRFVVRQKYFMNEGYTEAKAFELVEKEMSQSLQEEKYERGIIEGLATSNRARSLLSFYEQAAEFEARQKVGRLNRDLPDFIRAEKKWDNEIADILESKTTPEESTEKNYDPVSCTVY